MSTRSWKTHEKKCKDLYIFWKKCVEQKKDKDRSCGNSIACKPYFKLWLQCTNRYLEYGYRENPKDFKAGN